MSKIGINGFNRNSKILLRTLIEKEAKIVAINEPKLSLQEIVQLMKYDSNYGPWNGQVEVNF